MLSIPKVSLHQDAITTYLTLQLSQLSRPSSSSLLGETTHACRRVDCNPQGEEEMKQAALKLLRKEEAVAMEDMAEREQDGSSENMRMHIAISSKIQIN